MGTDLVTTQTKMSGAELCTTTEFRCQQFKVRTVLKDKVLSVTLIFRNSSNLLRQKLDVTIKYYHTFINGVSKTAPPSQPNF